MVLVVFSAFLLVCFAYIVVSGVAYFCSFIVPLHGDNVVVVVITILLLFFRISCRRRRRRRC